MRVPLFVQLIFVYCFQRKVTNRPLARTIRRGKTPKEDYLLENQLLQDEKQCAEHIMLVDLGRNDVGKVGCFPLIICVFILCMTISSFLHIIHIIPCYVKLYTRIMVLLGKW